MAFVLASNGFERTNPQFRGFHPWHPTEKTEAKTASGIIIPDTAQEKTQIATVIAVGDDKEKIKVVPGQKVMYDKYSGTSVKIDGEDHLILKAADVIAVIE